MKNLTITKNDRVTILGTTICLIGAFFYSYEFILRATPGIMTNQLMNAYQVSASGVGLLSTYYYVLYIPLQLPAGVLMDKYGPRLLLSASVLLCTIGSLVMAVTARFWVANLSQLIIGAGSAFAFIGAMKLATKWIPLRFFALFAGFTTMLGMIGAISTDIFLIELVDTINWRNTWFFLGVTGILISVLMCAFVQNAPTQKKPKLKTITNLINNKPQSWHEFNIEVKKIMHSKSFWINAIIGGILFLPITVLGTLWGIPYLQAGYHYNPHYAGMGIAMIFLGMAFGAPIAGFLSSLMQRKVILIRISCLLATIFSTILISTSHMSMPALYSIIFLLGFSLGPQVLVFPIATDMVNIKFAGTIVAATNFVLMIVSIITQPLVGYLLVYSWDGTLAADGTELLTFNDFQFSLAILPILNMIALLMSFFLQHKHSDKE